MKLYSQTQLKLTDQQYDFFKEMIGKGNMGYDINKYVMKVTDMRGESPWVMQKALADFIDGDPWRTRVNIYYMKPKKSILHTALLWLWVEGRTWWIGFLCLLILTNVGILYLMPGPKETWAAVLFTVLLVLAVASIGFTFINLRQFLPLENEIIYKEEE